MKMIQKGLFRVCFQPITMLNCYTTCISREIGSYNIWQSRHNEHTHFCREITHFCRKICNMIFRKWWRKVSLTGALNFQHISPLPSMTECHLRIMSDHSHCQHIYSSQNRCFKEFTNFQRKIVATKRLSAWERGVWVGWGWNAFCKFRVNAHFPYKGLP